MTVSLESCTCAYRRWNKPVLRDFSYEITDGVTVLLGPNGAGKSTLLKLAASLVRPRAGTVTYGQISALSKEYRRMVSILPQSITPMPSLTSREYVAYVGWLKGMSRRNAWLSSVSALERVQLVDQAETKTSRLSGGQLRRVGVAAALVHECQVLLLDEPTSGLDPQQRRVFRDILRELSGEVSVLMSTHDVADLADEADRVTVLDKGNILFDGSTDEFLGKAPPGTAAGRLAEGAYMDVLGRNTASVV
ncbi:ABC transporter ATP-binding protein [Streptomyces sp. JJ36]|uniref:ABC transporter ATP-binding protein n=1 Tax=Streptomyces sp. JJ36 TaxID=2736645 RepID=UPI001F02804F|nr:ATP-binding cassette domain-containing protein [Streptomyces sp. JJ36]MCF6525125.1 ATP-binding cassette domain-containing protein [Streptomyces sp. JJ36]